LRICKRADVDIHYANIESIYFEDELRMEAPAIRGFILEGSRRVGHFNGVLQVVMKLFNIILFNRPKSLRAYFRKERCPAVGSSIHLKMVKRLLSKC